MIDYLIGVDGGGTGTRVRVARADGTELAQGHGGPSGLGLGLANAWNAIDAAIAQAFASVGLARPPHDQLALGLGLAGVHNPQWAADFRAANPGYGIVVLETDSYTTLLGAHQGRPGAVVTVGTGSVGIVLLPDGTRREVGGWGFPSGDEGSGAWLGLRAMGHAQQALDGRQPDTAFTQAVRAACGGTRHALFAWLAQANQTRYAELAPIVLAHAATDEVAHRLLGEAGQQIERITHALDPLGQLPLALCGGLAQPLRDHLPTTLQARCTPPLGDACAGALHLLAQHQRQGTEQ